MLRTRLHQAHPDNEELQPLQQQPPQPQQRRNNQPASSHQNEFDNNNYMPQSYDESVKKLTLKKTDS